MDILVGPRALWDPRGATLAVLQVPTTVTAVLQDGRPPRAANTATAVHLRQAVTTAVLQADIRRADHQAVIRPAAAVLLLHNFRRLHPAAPRRPQCRPQASPHPLPQAADNRR